MMNWKGNGGALFEGTAPAFSVQTEEPREGLRTTVSGLRLEHVTAVLTADC
jgi:hypothetical protein